tara:strand:- start:2113 stop:3171 length:1059 start_codon:yes stop_codon:yes gene_type:complete
MRIAVIGTYPPQRDGIGIYSSRIVSAMKKAGHSVKVFSFKGNQNGNEVVGVLSKHNPFTYLSVVRKIKEFNPDKVLIQFEYVHYNLIWFSKMILGLKGFGYKPNIMMHTIVPYESGWKYYLFKLIHLCMFLFCSKVFVHTENAKMKLLKRTWLKPKIGIVPIAIKPVVDIKMPKQKFPFLLSFGFISQDKGIDVLCNAMDDVEAKLLISGSISPYAMKKQQDYLEELKKLVMGKENISLNVHYITERQKDDLFRKADFFVLPYRFIEQSAVLTEVWGYGKIPICSDVSGLREEIKGKYGVLFKNGDAEDLKRVINEIISNPSKQKWILKNIKELVQERSFDVCAGKIIEKMS